MKNKHISDEWKLNKKGHSNFDFVDVVINSDNRLFIDPCLIEIARTTWSLYMLIGKKPIKQVY